MPMNPWQYATNASGPFTGNGSWNNANLATGAPDGNTAQSVTAGAGGSTLTLSGYTPQAAILAATGQVQPAWLNSLYVQLTFSVSNPVNYDQFDVVLLASDGRELARSGLPLAQVSTQTVTVGTVSFDARASSIAWADLAGIQVQLVAHRIDTDALSIDAVALAVSYTTTAVPPPAAPAPPPTAAAKLRLYDQAGTLQATLPWTSLTRTIVHNDAGAIAASVPASLLAAIPDEPYLRVMVNGVEAPEWYLLDDDGDDLADAAGSARPVTIGGRGTLACLSWAVIYPFDHVPGKPMPLGIKTTFPFANATPGAIMAMLIDRAHARGAIPHISYDFTADHDSAGTPWPMVYSRVYELGQDLLKTLTDMDSDGWADFRMVGFTLQMFTPDSSPIAADRPDVILRLGQGVTSGPRKRSRTPIRSTILANGAQGTIIEDSDAVATGRYGRREGYEGRDGVTDYGTLDAVTQVSLARQTSESEAITLVVAPSVAAAIPGGVPAPGCYIRYDQRRLDASHFEPMRVQSVAYDYGESSPQVSIELNDLWVDNDIRTKRRIDAILNGSSANERVPQTPYVDDGIAPATPPAFSVVSAAYIDNNGVTQAQATANWEAPTADVNGSTLDDLAGYRIEWTQPTVNPGSHYVIPPGTQQIVSWSPLVAGEQLQSRISAVDRFGNWSPWSAWVSITAGRDETPPAQPTPPQVDNYLGLLRVYWDGGFVGDGRPADFAALEVHVSSVDGFAPDDTTLVGTLFAAGYAFADTPYGVPEFVRFVAVDVSGNRSTVSAEATATTGQILGPDVFDGCIGTSKLADLTVTTAKIGDLAVNNAKIGDLDVGKLTAGIMSANVTVSGRLATALTGQRVELNGQGIYAWDGVNATPFVSIDRNGATIVGGFRTGISGRRVELGLTSATTGRLDFFAPNGGNGFVQAFTEGSGLESVQLGVVIGGQTTNGLWNRLNINTQAWWNAHAWRHEYHYTANPQNGGSGSGYFGVFEDPDWTQAGGIGRFQLSTAGLNYWGYGNPQAYMAVDNNGLLDLKYIGDNGQLKIIGGGGGNSMRIQFFAPGGHGSMLKNYSDGRGDAIEARDWSDSSFVTVRGNDFSPQSDARTKAEIRDAADEVGGFVRQVKSARVRKYVRDHVARRSEVGEHGGFTGRAAPGSEVANTVAEIGLLAQEAPAQIVLGDEDTGLGISLYQMASLLWGAVHELDDRLVAVEKKGRP